MGIDKAYASAMATLFVLTVTLVVQWLYRKVDNWRKARSVALYASSTFEVFASVAADAIAHIVINLVEPHAPESTLDFDEIPEPPSFSHLRDIHELGVGPQQAIFIMEAAANSLRRMAIDANKRRYLNPRYRLGLIARSIQGALETGKLLRRRYLLPRRAVIPLTSSERDLIDMLVRELEAVRKERGDPPSPFVDIPGQ